jgi:hypothetical protein
MHWSGCAAGAALIALLIAQLPGCSSHRGDALAAYAAAPLAPAKGLGDILFGSPVKAFLERFGSGRVSVTLADELPAADLHFPMQGLAFRFVANFDCQRALTASGAGLKALLGLSEPATFLKRYPACALMPLQSIGADGSQPAPASAFAGATPRGTRLGSTRAELFAHEGILLNASAPSPLDGVDDASFERYTFVSGVVAFVRRSNGDPAQWKVAKLAVLDPET